MELDELTFIRLVGEDLRQENGVADVSVIDRVPLSRNSYCAEILADGTHAGKVACQIRELSRKGVLLLVFAAMSGERGMVLWLPDDQGNELVIRCNVTRIVPLPVGAQMCAAALTFLREQTAPPTTEQREAHAASDAGPAAPLDEAARIEAIRKAILD